jgi:hypothetical protein
LIAPPLLANTTAPITGSWSGQIRSKYKSSGDGVKAKDDDYLTLSFSFALEGGWSVSNLGTSLGSGTWLRRGNKVDLSLDAEGHASLVAAIADRLSAAVPGTTFDVMITKLKGKAKVKRTRSSGDIFSYSMVVAFQATGDGVSQKGKWKLKGKALRPSGPNPGTEPVLAKQDWFRELNVRMAVGRSSHTSTLLGDGTVLLAGGYTSGTTATSLAEVFDPSDERFLVVPTRMNYTRANHTAVRLPNGKVLLVGGEVPGSSQSLNSAELYNPQTGEFTLTEPMIEQRTSHAMAMLPDGRVLVCGGRTSGGAGTVWHRNAEIYDYRTGHWSSTANDMEKLRAGHQATLLTNGLVLVTGGSGGDAAEIFDPKTNSFRTLASPMMEPGRSLHGVVQLGTGIVLITNGGIRQGEYFSPTTETFSLTGNKDQEIRSAALTMHFRPNEVLIMGGIDFGASFLHGSMEQFIHDYLPGGRYFHIVPLPDEGVYLEEERAFSAATDLGGGRFLITGGIGPDYTKPDLSSAMIFQPPAR